ncbi:ABC transporter permease [candidate division KSB1 bacterium]|nr:ABC transporter permease [candidate division KSB1 bacterium]
MLTTYIKIIIRNVAKYKLHSFINIVGLAIGMASAILIFLWIQDELSYDQFHKNKNELYRVVRTNETQTYFTYNLPGALASTLKTDYPEITNATNYCDLHDIKLSNGEHGFYSALRFVDPAFFEMFTFPLKSGEFFTMSSNPNSIVITENLARKLFGNENAIGKAISMDDSQELSVIGVLENIPANSHIEFDGLLPMTMAPEDALVWTNNWPYTYIQLQKNVHPELATEKIRAVLQQHKQNSHEVLFLQPLSETYLHSFHNLSGRSRIIYIYIFGALAIVVLFTACINFINLFTAYSERRAKEIGIKKVVGSSRKQLIAQFLNEAIVFVLIALLVALIFVQLTLPHFNTLTDKQLGMTLSFRTLLMLIGITIVTGLTAGFYPALVMSAQRPISVLHSRAKKSFKQSYLRKTLIVIQFVFSVFLIVSVLVITHQMNYLQNRDLGFNKEHILVLKMRGKIDSNSNMLRNELLKNPHILKVATSVNPMERRRSDGMLQYGADRQINIGFNFVDCDFQETMEIEMAYGHFFSEKFQSDLKNGAVINEAAMRALELDDPIGKTVIRHLNSAQTDEYTIIGVTKDFNSESLHREIRPLMLVYSRSGNFMYVRIGPDNIPQTIRYIERTITNLIPDEPFSYQFLDDTIDSLYRSEQVMSKLTLYITFLAIFVSGLGLLGLVAFTTIQRKKEIGIRKALGASVGSIIGMLTKDLVKWVVMANIIAWPLAYYSLNQWLQNFAFRINMSLWMFVLAGLSALMIAFFTIGWQTVRAALANPIESLHYE